MVLPAARQPHLQLLTESCPGGCPTDETLASLPLTYSLQRNGIGVRGSLGETTMFKWRPDNSSQPFWKLSCTRNSANSPLTFKDVEHIPPIYLLCHISGSSELLLTPSVPWSGFTGSDPNPSPGLGSAGLGSPAHQSLSGTA